MTVLDEFGLDQVKPLIHGSRILVLSDEPTDAVALSTVLVSADFSCVVEAPRHRDPVAVVETVRPDLVLLDLASSPGAPVASGGGPGIPASSARGAERDQMPAPPGGIHLLARVRAAATGAGPLPLVVTTDADPGWRAEVLAAGADDVVVVKPLVAAELVARVRSWLIVRLLTERPRRSVSDPRGPSETVDQAFLEAMVNSMGEAVLACDQDGRTRFANAAALRLGLGGYLLSPRPALAPGRLRAVGGAELPAEQDPLRRAWSEQEAVDEEVAIGTADHGLRTLIAHARPIRAGGDRCLGAVATLHDVTERQRVIDELRRELLLDQVTGLPNSVLFFELASRILARAGRDHQPLTVIVVVVLDVEEITDHDAESGPAPFSLALAALAKRLPHLLRPGDVAGRFGDGFLLLCAAPVRESNAATIVGRLNLGLSRPLAISGRRLTAHLSFGAVTVQDADRSIERLARTALSTARRTAPASS